MGFPKFLNSQGCQGVCQIEDQIFEFQLIERLNIRRCIKSNGYYITILINVASVQLATRSTAPVAKHASENPYFYVLLRNI